MASLFTESATGGCDDDLAMSCACSMWLFPPLGLYWRFGCGKEVCISIPLTLLGYVPGAIYAGVCLVSASGPEAHADHGRVKKAPGVQRDGSECMANKADDAQSSSAHAMREKKTDLTTRVFVRKLAVVFCPDPSPASFTATYDRQPPIENFGSVNAGMGRILRVGGSGLNGQFEQDLTAAGHDTKQYQDVHRAIMAAACKCPGRLVHVPQDMLRHGSLQAAFGLVKRCHGSGFVAIDVFKQERRPLHNGNVAMIYCLGPDRRYSRYSRSSIEFLAAVTELGEAVAHACNWYNAFVANDPSVVGLPPLWRVRMSLVSGGKRAGDVPKADVARAILDGLSRGTQMDVPSGHVVGDEVVFEMAYNDDVFAFAWEALRGQTQQ